MARDMKKGYIDIWHMKLFRVKKIECIIISIFLSK